MNLSARWLAVGIRVWTFTCAAVIGGLFALTIVYTGCLAAVAWFLPPTWHETQRSPSYALNGRFQGEWVLERGSQPLGPGWERLELRVTEDLALIDDAYPDYSVRPLVLSRGVVARGTAASRDGSSAFELVADGRFYLELDASPGPSRLALSLDARDPGRLDTLSLGAADGRRSTYRRDVWFLPSP